VLSIDGRRHPRAHPFQPWVICFNLVYPGEPARRRRNRIEDWSDCPNSEEIHAAAAGGGRLASLPFDATALRPDPGLRSTPRGEPWMRGTESDRATVPERVRRVSDPRRRPPYPKGSAAPPVTANLAALGEHPTGKRSLLGTRLSCGAASRRMKPGAAPPPVKPTLLQKMISSRPTSRHQRDDARRGRLHCTSTRA
jgi:hypothetical protein